MSSPEPFIPTPALYVVPVPIGNLRDITLRALDVLSRADVIACEDTRTTRKLLSLYGIQAPKLVACHDHNEGQVAQNLARAIEQDQVVALVSDAGSPMVSDPGFKVVEHIIHVGLPLIALPGPTALIPALSVSGLANHRWKFSGFPPHKKGRKTFVEHILQEEDTVVLYESPHRIGKLLEQLCEAGGEFRDIAVCREISKKFEEVIRGTCREVSNEISQRGGLKGEIVVVVAGRSCL